MDPTLVVLLSASLAAGAAVLGPVPLIGRTEAPLVALGWANAVAAGLTFRPLGVTARDTLEWDKARPAEERANRRFGMSREREREVLDAWHASQG